MNPQTPDNEVAFPWKSECPRVSNYCDKHLRGYSIGSPWHGVIGLAFDLERELAEKTNEVARLRERLEKAEELIRGLHDGWKKARKAHLETCKNAQAEIDKLHTENQKLTELCETDLYYHENDEIRSQTRKQLDQLNHNPNNKPS